MVPPTRTHLKKKRAPRMQRRSIDSASVDGEGLDSSDDESSLPLDAIVKVFTSHADPNFCLPWQKHQQQRSSGTGFVIHGRHANEYFVITNAHCVEHHNQVQVKKRGDDTKFLATVLAIGWSCDLALLQVTDVEFFSGLTAVNFSRSLPRLEDAVLCVGYPLGGETLSITSGVVSRVEVIDYTQNHAELLGIQIDAAINSGNSGGPAFDKKTMKCVGVAFQGLSDAENIGYIIPVVVVDHFLEDLLRNNGVPKGFPSLGIGFQLLENPFLRKAAKVNDKDKSHKGVLIRRVKKTSCAHDILLEGDVLCAFNEIDIGNDGTTSLRKGERVAFSWQISKLFHGDATTMRILRNGEPMTLSITLQQDFVLVPPNLPDGQKMPTYFIVGGLVFTPLLQPYLEEAYGDDWETNCPVEVSYQVGYAQAEDRDTQLISLAQVLAHDITIGYQDLDGSIVMKVNGEKIKNIRHLQQRVMELRKSKEPFLRFELHDKSVIVLDPSILDKSEQEILVDHAIPSLLSADLALPAGQIYAPVYSTQKESDPSLGTISTTEASQSDALTYSPTSRSKISPTAMKKPSDKIPVDNPLALDE